MNVTNSLNGGASQCSECPLGVGSEGKGYVSVFVTCIPLLKEGVLWKWIK